MKRYEEHQHPYNIYTTRLFSDLHNKYYIANSFDVWGVGKTLEIAVSILEDKMKRNGASESKQK